jgi:hypothetical protein
VNRTSGQKQSQQEDDDLMAYSTFSNPRYRESGYKGDRPPYMASSQTYNQSSSAQDTSPKPKRPPATDFFSSEKDSKYNSTAFNAPSQTLHARTLQLLQEHSNYVSSQSNNQKNESSLNASYDLNNSRVNQTDTSIDLKG